MHTEADEIQSAKMALEYMMLSYQPVQIASTTVESRDKDDPRR